MSARSFHPGDLVLHVPTGETGRYLGSFNATTGRSIRCWAMNWRPAEEFELIETVAEADKPDWLLFAGRLLCPPIPFTGIWPSEEARRMHGVI